MKDEDSECFKVVKYETKTGIILDQKNEGYYFGDGEYSKFFNNEKEAKAYIRKNISPGAGYFIYDVNDKLIYENVYDELIRVEKKCWWQFWK